MLRDICHLEDTTFLNLKNDIKWLEIIFFYIFILYKKKIQKKKCKNFFFIIPKCMFY